MNRRRFLPLLAVVPVAAAVVCGAGDRRILSADDNELIFIGDEKPRSSAHGLGFYATDEMIDDEQVFGHSWATATSPYMTAHILRVT